MTTDKYDETQKEIFYDLFKKKCETNNESNSLVTKPWYI